MNTVTMLTPYPIGYVGQVLDLRFYCEGTVSVLRGIVLVVCGCVDAAQVWRARSLRSSAAERHTASAASAWLEPQRLHERSLRLHTPGTFPEFQAFQIQAPLSQSLITAGSN